MKAIIDYILKWFEKEAPIITIYAKTHNQLLKELGLLLVLLFTFITIFLLPSNTEERTKVIEIFVKTVGGLAVFFGAYVAWKKHEVSLHNLKLAEEGQITERFTRAIEQLGSGKLEIRLGGIYALERIAKDSEKYHWPIMEVLTAYVRENSSCNEPTEPLDDIFLAADIEAIVSVIGRRQRTYMNGEIQVLMLSNVKLPSVNLSSARFEGVNLSAANLAGAKMDNAILDNANMHNTILSGTYMVNTSLVGTNLCGANLLEAFGLSEKQIEGAIIDQHTKLPEHLMVSDKWYKEQIDRSFITQEIGS